MNGKLNGNLKYIAFAVLLLANGLALGVGFGTMKAEIRALTHELELFRAQDLLHEERCRETAARLNQHLIEDGS